MNIWSTFRFVPPIAPEAMAWAALSFATYLAASEMQPQIGGHVLAPLALAVAIQLVLSTTRHLTSYKFARSYARAPKTSIALPALLFCGFAAIALRAPDVVAVKLMILYYLGFAAILSWGAAYAPRYLYYMQGTWTGSKKAHRSQAVMLEAAGLVICAATLVTTWTFAGPMAFAAMMSIGVLVMRTMANWVIVLYLLDVRDRDETRGGER